MLGVIGEQIHQSGSGWSPVVCYAVVYVGINVVYMLYLSNAI